LISGLLALVSAVIVCSTPVVLWHLINLISDGNTGTGLVFAVLLAVLFFVKDVATSREKFINNRYYGTIIC
jgi:hypothetical protein